MLLRKTARQHEPGGSLRKIVVPQWIEDRHRRARRFEHLDVLGIAERESRSARDRDHRLARDPFDLGFPLRPRPSTGAEEASARTASRSTCFATAAAIASTADTASGPCSAAVTSPKCREGKENCGSRGNTPSTSQPDLVAG